MRSLKSLLMVAVVLFLGSCSMSANSDKNESGKVSEQKKGEVIVLNKADFLSKVFNYEKNPTQWMYEGDKPCIIDFYADWCGPCRMVSPIVDEIAEESHSAFKSHKLCREGEIFNLFCGKAFASS